MYLQILGTLLGKYRFNSYITFLLQTGRQTRAAAHGAPAVVPAPPAAPPATAPVAPPAAAPEDERERYVHKKDGLRVYYFYCKFDYFLKM